MSRFDDCLKVTLNFEGGYGDDPDDAGGATNLGIEFGEWNKWKQEHGDSPSSLSEFAHDLTPADVAPLYHQNYWLAMDCDSLPRPLDMVAFDVAVLEGTGRSWAYLSATHGVNDPKLRALSIIDLRKQHFAAIVAKNPSQGISYNLRVEEVSPTPKSRWTAPYVCA